MQIWNKEPRPEIAATSRKQEGIQQECQADFQTGVHDTSSRDIPWVGKNERWDIMEGLGPSETEKDTAHGGESGNV
jgi:hypothetical protein